MLAPERLRQQSSRHSDPMVTYKTSVPDFGWIASDSVGSLSRQAQCLSWVNRALAIHRPNRPLSALAQSRPKWCVAANAVMCHVWTAPSWQELSSLMQRWSVQPCVRPLSAAHGAAAVSYTHLRSPRDG